MVCDLMAGVAFGVEYSGNGSRLNLADFCNNGAGKVFVEMSQRANGPPTLNVPPGIPSCGHHEPPIGTDFDSDAPSFRAVPIPSQTGVETSSGKQIVGVSPTANGAARMRGRLRPTELANFIRIDQRYRFTDITGCNGEEITMQVEELRCQVSLEKKYGGLVPKKKPLISKDTERA